MADGKSFALSLALMVGICATAHGSDQSSDSSYFALLTYWQGQKPGATVLSNQSLGLSTAAAAAPVVVPTVPPSMYNANINFDTGYYPDAAGLVNSGTITSWSASPSYTRFLGGNPATSQDVQAFEQDVLGKVRNIFAQSGLGQVSITANANPASAQHTISVIGGATYDGSHDILGMTYVGGSGFSYLNNFQNGMIDSQDKLETALARNISHELMHAFGGGHVHDTGLWVDSATTTWNSLVSPDPNANVFSAEAANNITGLLNGTIGPNLASSASGEHVDGYMINGRHVDGQQIAASPVPEPSTWIGFGLVGLAGIAWRSRKARQAA